jgi:hypothetical protein
MSPTEENPCLEPCEIPGEIHADVVSFVCDGLEEKREGAPASFGVALVNPLTVALIESTVRSALEYAASSWGTAGVNLTLAHKDQIRALIGPKVLAYVDTIIHGLQDPKVVQPAS